jgi:hypothetical protein
MAGERETVRDTYRQHAASDHASRNSRKSPPNRTANDWKFELSANEPEDKYNGSSLNTLTNHT